MRLGRAVGALMLFLALVVCLCWMFQDGSYRKTMGPVWNIGMALLEIGFVVVVLFKELTREDPIVARC